MRAARIRGITLPPYIWRKLKAARIRGYFARNAKGRRRQRVFGVLGHGTPSDEGNACWECYFAGSHQRWVRAACIGTINMLHLSFVFRRQVTPRMSRGKVMLRIRAAHGSNGRCPRPSPVLLRKVTLPMRVALTPRGKATPRMRAALAFPLPFSRNKIPNARCPHPSLMFCRRVTPRMRADLNPRQISRGKVILRMCAALTHPSMALGKVTLPLCAVLTHR